jgi:hypothetical protein
VVLRGRRGLRCTERRSDRQHPERQRLGRRHQPLENRQRARPGYCVKLEGTNLVGTSADDFQLVTTAEGTPPSAPTNLTASNITQTSATLSWTASTDNVGVDFYEVFENGDDLDVFDNPAATVQLSCGATKSFTVSAFDAAGNESPQSAALQITGAACPVSNTPPPIQQTPPAAKTCLAGFKKKTVKSGSGKKSFTLVVLSKVAADKSSVKVTASVVGKKAKVAKPALQDSAGVDATGKSATVTQPGTVTLTYKDIKGKKKTLSLVVAKTTC